MACLRAMSLLAVAALLGGCGASESEGSGVDPDASSDAGGAAADVSTDGAGSGDGVGADGGADDAAGALPIDEGLWQVRMAFAEFGGVEARFEMDVMGVSETGIERVDLIGVSASGARSDVLATAEAIAFEDATFVADFGAFTIPADVSPTNAPIDLVAQVNAEIAARDFVCGFASGTIPAFGIDFSRTTFGAVAPGAPDESDPPLSCDRSTGGGAPDREVVTIGPEGRPAALELPAGAGDEVRPIVMVLHGRSASGQIQVDYFGLRALQDELGYLLVIPEGLRASDGGQFWNATRECCDSDGTGVDDVSYLMALADEVQAEHMGGELYVVGHSNGGWMSHRVICDRPERVAGILALAGSSFSAAEDCGFEGAASVVLAHGTEDLSVPYEGVDRPGYVYPGAEALAARWVERMGCGEDAEVGAARDYDEAVEGDETTVATWEACEEGGRVALWTLEGASHVPSIDAEAFTGDALRFMGVGPR